MNIRLSRHAEDRMRQRGIRDRDVRSLMAWADTEVAVGRSLHALSWSREALADALEAGISATSCERLGRMVVVKATSGTIVTCAHMHGRKANAYRGRAQRKFWRN